MKNSTPVKLISLIIFILLNLCSFLSFSQLSNKCSNLILNPTFNGTSNSPTSDEFASGLVPNWCAVVGTPHLANNGTSAPYCAEMYSTRPWPNGNGVGEIISQHVNLYAGENYIVAFKAMRDSFPPQSVGLGDISIELSSVNNNCLTFGQYLTGTLSIFRTGVNNTQWQTYTFCFTPTINYFNVTIRPFANDANIYWLKVDDFEIYEVKPELGANDSLCIGDCKTIGVSCSNNPLNFNFSYEWRTSPNSSPFATTESVTVCPTNNTTYYLKAINPSCDGSDSVTLLVFQRPSVELGPDTILCGISNFVLDAGYNSTYSYLWNTMDTTATLNVTQTGKYIVEVTNPAGCTDTDSVYVIVAPSFYLHPKDTIVCPNDINVTICVDSGYNSYEWSTGDTTPCIHVNTAGMYIITVKDSMGCERTDTAFVDTLQFFPNIGTDKIICEGDSVTICDSNLSISNMFKFQWYKNNNIIIGDTLNCITVSQSGQFKLNAWTRDSCIGTDSINVLVIPRPHVTCSNIFICPNSPPFKIDSCTITNTGGYSYKSIYSGTGVYFDSAQHSYYFNPAAAYLGNNTIELNITYDTLLNCSYTYLFNIFVDSFKADIQPVNPICITEGPKIILANPDSGIWNNNPALFGRDFLFDPHIYGVGIHKILFSYTSPSGCTTKDSIFVTVIDSMKIIVEGDLVNDCDVGAYHVTARISGDTNNNNNLGYIYTWSNKDVQSSTTFYEPGTDTVIVRDPSGLHCPDTAIFIIETNCCNATAHPPRFPKGIIIGVAADSLWENDTIYLDYDVIIEDSATLTIRNCKIITRNCMKFIVKSSYNGGSYGGMLNIDNSKIGYCNWQGIEVWGSWDACAEAPAHGRLTISNNSLIRDANIGIFVGKRDTGPNFRHYVEYTGGRIDVQNSRFRHNYVDIMFSAWSFAGACTCPLNPPFYGVWQSNIQNNIFDTLATNEVCDTFVKYTLKKFNDFYNHYLWNCITQFWYLPLPSPTRELPIKRCHIMDLSPYTEFWTAKPLYSYLCPALTCKRSFYSSDGILRNITLGNQYFSPTFCNHAQ